MKKVEQESQGEQSRDHEEGKGLHDSVVREVEFDRVWISFRKVLRNELYGLLDNTKNSSIERYFNRRVI